MIARWLSSQRRWGLRWRGVQQQQLTTDRISSVRTSRPPLMGSSMRACVCVLPSYSFTCASTPPPCTHHHHARTAVGCRVTPQPTRP